MLKIRSFQKRILKISIMTFLVMISSLIFSNQVSAKELTDFCEYTNPCLTTERIEEILIDNSIIATDYLVTLADYGTSKYFYIVPITKEDIENRLFYITGSSIKNFMFLSGRSMDNILVHSSQNIDKFDTNITSFTINNIGANSQSSIAFARLIGSGQIYAYYSTLDILDENGNVYFEANSEEDLPENDFNVNTYTFNNRKYNLHSTGIENYISNVNYQTINQLFYNQYGHYLEDDDYMDSFFLYYSNDGSEKANLLFFNSSEFTVEGQTSAGVNLYFFYNVTNGYTYNQLGMSLNASLDTTKYVFFNNVDNDLSKFTYSSSTSSGIIVFELHATTKNSNEDVNIYYYTNAQIPIRDGNHIVEYTKNNAVYVPSSNEFTINIIDSEFGHNYGVNYIQGEQDNNIEFYIEDSGILLDSHAKGYEIDKIYYDDVLTQEALLSDVLEKNTTLYVTWKSKIEIKSVVATDLSGNDVITLNFNFSNIYNENYTYWISSDGTNYVNITDSLTNGYFYNTSVYFSGIYYAKVQDENSQTISVNYIDIDYYRITPNTNFGNDMDKDGNLKPYVILDYSSYIEIKDKIICEYSIDNGITWVNITNELDENLKYKLYINVGDKIMSRVRTLDTVLLPNTSFGSSYDVDEEFYNNIINFNQQSEMNDSFNSFLTPIKFIFESITNFYNNYCPNIVQNFIFISFTFVVIIVLIKLFL